MKTVTVSACITPTLTPTPTPTQAPIPPVPTPSCGVYNSDSETTPITWSWSPTQASGLQVWDNIGDWWFNAWTNPPHIDFGIPTGRTATARTTYNFTTFSSTASITCPTPTPIPTKTPTPTPTKTPTPTPTKTPTPTPTSTPTPTPCPTAVPTSLSPALTCTKTIFRVYFWNSVVGATGYEFQLWVGDPAVDTNWCRNVYVDQAAMPFYNLSSPCDNAAVGTATGAITWNVIAYYPASCSATNSLSYPLDKTAPTVPSGLTATCDVNGKVSASWGASTDTTCSGVDSYWAQVSKDSTFATAYSDSSWANGWVSWTSGTSRSTNNAAFSGGDTVYVHVQSRDALNNQSGFPPQPPPPLSTVCPIPTGTIQARAVAVDPTNTSCATIRAGGTGGISNTSFQFTPSSPSHPVAQQQSGSSYVVFNNVIIGDYGIDSSPPPGYVLARTCWADAPGSTTGETSYATLGILHTLTWDIGYTHGVAWSQAQGGDVYASGTLKSYVPVSPPLPDPRAFILDGTTGGYPGVATYGTSATFDSSGVTNGQDWVSSKKWLVKDTSPGTDFYQLMHSQFGGEPATWDYDNASITQPTTPYKTAYYADGNNSTSGNWTITNGNKLVIFVNGNLTINGTITIAPGGFAAFIVNGSITVDPAVAALQGIYITSPAGTFKTGTGAVRFVGTGMFIAGNFELKRDVGDAGNTTTASELFIYNPQLWMTMPEQMKKLSVSWQEVAP
ncbi:MAG: hypothetical protein NT149_01025 [Candidatus Gottesmanbacteria bacterium]|nr:hypothetical protein [Candidatus Gottesmanbacteria bacterium]